MTKVIHNSGNNEWYTPPHIIEAARRTMGMITLDPASNVIANQIVKADVFYTEGNSGLTKGPWQGKIWMNPPYAKGLIDQFVDKFIESMTTWQEPGRMTDEALVLVNNCTETKWFHRLANDAVGLCLLKKRLKFLNPDLKPAKSPIQGQVILYFGPAHGFYYRFERNFEHLGLCFKGKTYEIVGGK